MLQYLRIKGSNNVKADQAQSDATLDNDRSWLTLRVGDLGAQVNYLVWMVLRVSTGDPVSSGVGAMIGAGIITRHGNSRPLAIFTTT